MEDYQKRMLEEHQELVERLGKLEEFIESPKFGELEEMEKADLICQEHAMVLYERFLGSRMLRAGLFDQNNENNG